MRFFNALFLVVLALGLATPALATFSLTKYNAYGFVIDSDVRKRAVQRMTLHITAANTDTDLDIGDDTGTFWTAVQADTTYGALGGKALATIQAIDDNVYALNNLGGLEEWRRGATSCESVHGSCDTAATDETTASYDEVTCSGLLTTDTVRAVTMKTASAGNAALTGWTVSAAGLMGLWFTSPPGATGVARVAYTRADTECYVVDSISSGRPNLTFVSGSAPTSYVLTLEWELKDEKYIIRADYGS